MQFKAQYDFAGGDADFKDVWLGLQKIPYIGKFRIGQQKEPFSLEEQTSSNYITFLERGLPNVFSPSRNTGFLATNSHFDDRLTWGVGGFKESDDFGDSFSNRSDWNATARITGLPWVDENKLLHLGLSYSHQWRSGWDNPVRYRQRPESHITDKRFVDTGEIPVDNINLLNPEIAFVWGPFSVQAEYFHSFVDVAGNEIKDEESEPFPDENLDFSGVYAYATFFLTGEIRPYKGGKFGRVKPLHNFSFKDPGLGAFELAARYSYLDLSDETVDGGRESNWTAGLNWYLNPNTRMMFNYIKALVKQHGDMLDDGDADIFMTRFQIDF
jgi:phosphate-selective porin OprO/OprP